VDLRHRHEVEEEFHDAKAVEGVNDFYNFGALEIPDAFAVSALGDVRGKLLLDIGCGDGANCVRFAKAGASVTGIDISGEMVELTKKTAALEGVGEKVYAVRMSGEELQFPDASFDLIYGHSILHHLNLEVASRDLQRILRPGGIAVFVEPLNYNPVLNLFRRLTPQRRTPTEKPLTFRQVEDLARAFSSSVHREFHLFSLCAFIWYYGLRSKRLFQATIRAGSRFDSLLFKIMPSLRHYAWVSVIRLVK
jgi:SAM-dependent methyltransferase